MNIHRAFLISVVDSGEWLASLPGRFIPGKRDPGTHWIGDCAGSRVDLDAVAKEKVHPQPLPGIEPLPSSP
jgi:hypothetical protein